MNSHKTVLLAIVCALTFSCAQAPEADPQMVRADFVVEGMHCDGCSTSITADLEAMDGVVRAAADHEAGTAEATFDPGKVEPEQLKTTIEDLGYTVISTETSPVVDG
jgi:copper chaperone